MDRREYRAYKRKIEEIRRRFQMLEREGYPPKPEDWDRLITLERNVEDSYKGGDAVLPGLPRDFHRGLEALRGSLGFPDILPNRLGGEVARRLP